MLPRQGEVVPKAAEGEEHATAMIGYRPLRLARAAPPFRGGSIVLRLVPPPPQDDIQRPLPAMSRMRAADGGDRVRVA